MRQTILRLLEKPNIPLTQCDRAILESLLAITSDSGAVSTTSEALREELARRQERPLPPANYRQRMKRLGDTLENAKATFRLIAARGVLTAQPTLESDKDTSTGTGLIEHSGEKTLPSTEKTIPPMALPERRRVLFSYARFDGSIRAIHDEFFQELEQLLAYPPYAYKGLKVELWRDTRDIRNTSAWPEQLKQACQESFFGLLMLSTKYPHSDYCMREATHFLTQDGGDIPGKFSLIVPVNVHIGDVKDRFDAAKRQWHPPGDDNLQAIWATGNHGRKSAFVLGVAEEIWHAAATLPGGIPHSGRGNRKVLRHIEDFAHRRRYEHDAGGKVPPIGREGQLNRSPSPNDDDAIPRTGTGGIDIVPHLVQWAVNPGGPRLVALLGDFGMGKTVTCQLLTQKLLELHRNDPANPLPVYLDLRDIDRPEAAGSTSLEDLIDQMLRRPGTHPPAAAEVISYIRERDALIIFDGLDEVTNKLTTDQASRLYRELLSVIPAETWRAAYTREGGQPPATRGPRILVSCRTHYFKDIASQRSFLIHHDRARISADEDVKIYYLLPFTEQQIATYLGFYLDEAEKIRALALIKDTYNLQELAVRPIFLTFIRQTLDQIEKDKRAGRTINIARLYDIFVQNSLERDDPKHVIPIREKRELLAGLALTMHKRRRDALSNDALDGWFDEAAAHLPKLRRALQGADGVSAAGRFLQDLRNASFLVRPGDEEFRFAHTSVREYFLANAVHKTICERRGDDLDMAPLSKETVDFLLARQAVASEESQGAFLEHFPALLEQRRPARLRELAFAIWLASAAKLPRPSPMDLSDLDFSRRVFRGTQARPLSLARTIWKGTKLRQTEFDCINLEGADFGGATAPMSLWLSCRLAGAKWSDAELTGSRWRDCAIDAGAFANGGANVREAIDCTLGGKGWQPRRRVSAYRWRAMLERHSGAVRSVVLGRLRERNVIVSGGYDGSVRVWDAASGECLAVLEGHLNAVRSVALGRLGTCDVIVSSGDDSSVRVWDAASGECLAVLEGHTGWVYSVALGRIGTRDVIVTGGDDCSIRVWNASGECLAVLEGHSGWVNSLALGRLGTRDVIVTGGDDCSIRIWDASGECLAVFEGHWGWVRSVAMGRIGMRDVIVSGGYGSIRIWDAASGACHAVLEGHSGGVNSVVLGRLGMHDVIVSGGDDHSVRVWDAASGECLAMLEGHTGWVFSVAMGRLGMHDVIVSGGDDSSVRVWNADGECQAVLEGNSSRVRSVVLGRLGEHDVIVSGAYDNSVRVWDAASSECVAVLEGHTSWVFSVALGRLGKRDVIVSGGYDNCVRVWDAMSGECQAVLQGQWGGVRTVTLGRLGERDVIVSGGLDGSVRVWDATSGECLDVLEGHSGCVRSVVLGRLGTRDVIVSGSSDNSIRIWDVTSGPCQAVLKGHKGRVRSVALGQLGIRDIIVSGGDDYSIRVWDAVTGECQAVLKGHKGRVRSVALGRLGTRDVIVSGGDDNSVRLWDAASSECLAVLEGHSDWVYSVALGRLGTRDVIVSGGDDSSVRVWDAADALATGPTSQRILDLRPDAPLDLAPDDAGGYRITRASPDAWRYYIAQGHDARGRLVTAPIETMFAKKLRR